MNAITTVSRQPAAITDDRAIEVMQSSLYPGARPESVALVLGYCKARGLDPMLKPVHIVPMWVKDAVTGQGGMRDVVMPGIPLYRIQAARTGAYAGKSEPEFGPDVTRRLDGVEVTFPQWCRVAVTKIVEGRERQFVAKEFWLENYATAKKDSEAPNAMWRKRPYGQLAKCVEAQALRMAFPEETGGEPTAEEMDGKTFSGATVDHGQAQPQRLVREMSDAPISSDGIPSLSAPPPQRPKPTPMQWFTARIAALESEGDCFRLFEEGSKAKALMDQQPEEDRAAIRKMLEARLLDFVDPPNHDDMPDDGFPGDRDAA